MRDEGIGKRGCDTKRKMVRIRYRYVVVNMLTCFAEVTDA